MTRHTMLAVAWTAAILFTVCFWSGSSYFLATCLESAPAPSRPSTLADSLFVSQGQEQTSPTRESIPPEMPEGEAASCLARECPPGHSVASPPTLQEIFRTWAAGDQVYGPLVEIRNGPWLLIPQKATEEELAAFKTLVTPILERWREDRQRLMGSEPVETPELERAFKMMLDGAKDARDSIWRG